MFMKPTNDEMSQVMKPIIIKANYIAINNQKILVRSL